LTQDQRIVAVPASDTFGCVEVVLSLEFHLSNFLSDIDELINRDEFAATEIDRLDNFALHNSRRTLQAVIDIHETPRLEPISPDFDLVRVHALRLNDFAADSSGSFLAAAIPCSPRTVDVVVADNACGEAEVLAKMAGHALAE